MHGEALRLRRAVGDRRFESASLMNLGSVAEAQGDWSGAETLYRQSLALYRELQDLPGIASTLSNLGRLQSRSGHLTAASENLAEALSVQQELGHREKEAETLEFLADLNRIQGEVTAAEDSLSRAREIYRAVGAPSGEAQALLSLAELAIDRLGGPAARALAEEADRIAGQGPTPLFECSLERLKGLIEGSEGRPEEAARHLRRALRLSRDLGHREAEAIISTDLARLLLDSGAATGAQEALAGIPPGWRRSGAVLGLRARVAAAGGDFRAAADLGRQAREASREAWTDDDELALEGYLQAIGVGAEAPP